MKRTVRRTVIAAALIAIAGTFHVPNNTAAANPGAVPVPNANTITLKPRMAVSQAGCPVRVWVGYVSSSGQRSGLGNYLVKFSVVSGTGAAPAQGPTASNGNVDRIVPWNTTIRATSQSYVLLTSSDYVCGPRPTGKTKLKVSSRNHN